MQKNERFQFGVGCSVFQASGLDSSNWSRFVRERWPFRWLGISAFRGKFNLGDKGCDFWNRYKEDLGLAKKLGCTSFRFSFEWARIEPSQGHYDAAAIQRFHDILDTMEELGLEPNATLHHFTHPTWFEELGGFMKEENVPIFVEWAQFMFHTFHQRIKLWAIFNEPTAYTFLSFIVGLGPSPRYVSNIFNLTGAGHTLLNLLKAHTTTYWALKALPGGKEASIGMVHHHIMFGALDNSVLYRLATWVSEWLSYWMGWDIMDHWMCTGEFEWRLPVLGTWIKWADPGGKPPCDWWGINFYSHPVAQWNLRPACLPHQIMTDMFYPIYPEGLYAAIQRSSRYGIPMYITETGIADHRDDRRALLIETYFREVLRALANGLDVRGFYYWTLVDNFEWTMGYTMKFGLYAWEPDGSVDRVLKPGAQALVCLYNELPHLLRDLQDYARGSFDMGLSPGVEMSKSKRREIVPSWMKKAIFFN